MLTRRGFSGFASCAICGLTGFIATDASAQGSPPAGSPSFRRKILSQTDGPVPGYVTIIVDAEVDPESWFRGTLIRESSLPMFWKAPWSSP